MRKISWLKSKVLLFGIVAGMTIGLGTVDDLSAAVLSVEDFNLYGYVDISYTQNFNNPANKVNQNAGFVNDSNSFRPDLAQIVLEKEAKMGGNLEDNAGFRVKLDFGDDTEFTGGTDASSGTDFQEIYGQFIVPIGNGLDLRFGRINSVIGYELIESPYNPNFTRSFLFNLGVPFTTTGIRLSYEFNKYVSFNIGAINSFTGTTSDTNNGKSVESSLSLNLTDWLNLTLYGFFGPEGLVGQKNAGRVLGGGILSIQATDNLSFVVDAYYNNQANAILNGKNIGNARWNGVAGYAIYDLNKQWGVRIRGEIFEDAAGFVTCLGTTAAQPKAQSCASLGPIPQTLWANTATLQYKPVSSVITRAEFRYDKSNRNTFLTGTRPTNNQERLMFQFIYLF